jgi:hypothetical protein
MQLKKGLNSYETVADICSVPSLRVQVAMRSCLLPGATEAVMPSYNIDLP